MEVLTHTARPLGPVGHSLPTISKVFATWADDGSLWRPFVARVRHLAAEKHLDLRVLHGDGTNTVTKKGGDRIGDSGVQNQKGETVIAIIDTHSSVLAPVPMSPVDETDWCCNRACKRCRR
jgi:hypothetical protein